MANLERTITVGHPPFFTQATMYSANTHTHGHTLIRAYRAHPGGDDFS